ncbi:MAG TPA: tyrosine-type recombinase/integrase [Vicinamibacterales bacterium]|nr:tyrosine-type recombinase/integrase [Vicinamibacterales bacterium]
MPVLKLTNSNIRKLLPGKFQIDYFDTEVRKLALRVSPSGRRTWVLLYRHQGRLRRYTLGDFPTLGLSAARKLARSVLQDVAAQKDPAAEKRAARIGPTVKHLALELLKRMRLDKKKSWPYYERLLNKEVLPKWGSRKVADVKRYDVRTLVEHIHDERGRVYLANRTFAVVSAMFTFAVERDLIALSPCYALKPPGKERRRTRCLSAEEIRLIWTSLDGESPAVAAHFRLRFLTAQRGGELLAAKWSDFDLKNGVWVIPEQNAKNDTEHNVPLSKQAVELLLRYREWILSREQVVNDGRAAKGLPRRPPNEWLFPSPFGDNERVQFIQKASQRLRQKSGVTFRPHDIRRTVSTELTAAGAHRIVLKKILNHVDQDVTGTYDRYPYAKEMRFALEGWSRRLQDILAGKEDASENVIPFIPGRR